MSSKIAHLDISALGRWMVYRLPRCEGIRSTGFIYRWQAHTHTRRYHVPESLVIKQPSRRYHLWKANKVTSDHLVPCHSNSCAWTPAKTVQSSPH